MFARVFASCDGAGESILADQAGQNWHLILVQSLLVLKVVNEVKDLEHRGQHPSSNIGEGVGEGPGA